MRRGWIEPAVRGDHADLLAATRGAEAGNIALKVLAAGGMYLGGGIAPKSLKTLQAGGFMQAFLDKGRLSPVLESIAVRVILDDTCALMRARRRMRRRRRRRLARKVGTGRVGEVSSPTRIS